MTTSSSLRPLPHRNLNYLDVKSRTNDKGSPMRSHHLLTASALAAAALLMSGCAGFQNSSAPSGPVQVAGPQLAGKLYGGQQPVTGATIQLYQAGTSGYGAGATALISGAPVTTGVGGNFSITGRYSCTTGSQVYLTATGGDSGAGQPNSAIAMMAALGPCENLTPSTFIIMNEVTTVAGVWALSPFMNGQTIGAPASNQSGLAQAFADVNQLTNTTTGTAPGPALAAGAVAPVAEINTLADILASCVNSQGTGGGGACDTLFTNATPPGGTTPSDTITAAVNIARNPGRNVSNLLALASPTAPFQPELASANDFTVGVTYPVGNTPAALAVDAANNVWVVNNGSNSVTKLSHGGAPLSGATGFATGTLPTSIAIDPSGNVWITNSGSNTLTELSSSGVNAGGSPFSGGGLNAPSSIAIDGLGMIWVANSGNKTVSAFSSNGTPVSSASGYPVGGTGTAEIGIAINPH